MLKCCLRNVTDCETNIYTGGFSNEYSYHRSSVILVILIAAVIALYFFGKKAQKKQDEQQAQIQANKQTVSMLVIDKKRMPLKDSGLPQMVIDQTPKLMRRSKLPIVKAKVGPKINILIADEKV
mgnify:CR=1 FL=1